MGQVLLSGKVLELGEGLCTKYFLGNAAKYDK